MNVLNSAARVIAYYLTFPIWVIGLAAALVAFAVGGIVPMVWGAYVYGGEFAAWVFDHDRRGRMA